MHNTYRNVNGAFKSMVHAIHTNEILTLTQPSRVGEVRMIPEPVTITYLKPYERVLANRNRDANPFFHLFESLWMLAGRRDVSPLKYYSSKIGEIASDDGKTFHGAYGDRWREYSVDAHAETHLEEIGFDQLGQIAANLRENPSSRREVLTMWDVERDLAYRPGSAKDLPCNTHAYVTIRELGAFRFLDLTVCNRSNDMIWGMFGANAVHFSFLQEYLAAKLGVEVGVYNQFSNNVHVYTERWDPRHWLAEYQRDMHSMPLVQYDGIEHFPLMKNQEQFDGECLEFVERHSETLVPGNYNEPFLREVAQPAMVAFHRYKNGDLSSAIEMAVCIDAKDWRIVCQDWLYVRKLRRTNSEKTRKHQG